MNDADPTPHERWHQDVREAREQTRLLRADPGSPWRQVRDDLLEAGCEPNRTAATQAPFWDQMDLLASALCADDHAFEWRLREREGGSGDGTSFHVAARRALEGEAHIRHGLDLSYAAQVLVEEGFDLDPITYLAAMVGLLDDDFRDESGVYGEWGGYPKLRQEGGFEPDRVILFNASWSFRAGESDWRYTLLDRDDGVVELSTHGYRQHTDVTRARSTYEPVIRRILTDSEARERYGPWLEAANRYAARHHR